MNDMLKYKLTSETRNDFGRTLYRIQALRDFGSVKSGDLGGFIQSVNNLSQEGDCWVCNNARVCDNAWVFGDAMVYGDARVFGNAMVYGDAKVFGNAQVFGDARVSVDSHVSDNAQVFDNAWASGDSRVFGNARVLDNAQVFSNAKVFGDALVFDNAMVFDNAQVFGDARVYGDADVFGDALVFGDARVYGDANVFGDARVYGDAAKRPLLLDPTSKDDPWEHLDFDPQTGNFAPRYDANKIPAPKGKATVDTLHLDKRESLASGHQKAYKRISDRITDAANAAAPDAALLISGLKNDDEYGLLGWCFRGAGINEPPMANLRQAHPAIWAACVSAFKNY